MTHVGLNPSAQGTTTEYQTLARWLPSRLRCLSHSAASRQRWEETNGSMGQARSIEDCCCRGRSTVVKISWCYHYVSCEVALPAVSKRCSTKRNQQPPTTPGNKLQGSRSAGDSFSHRRLVVGSAAAGAGEAGHVVAWRWEEEEGS